MLNEGPNKVLFRSQEFFFQQTKVYEISQNIHKNDFSQTPLKNTKTSVKSKLPSVCRPNAVDKGSGRARMRSGVGNAISRAPTGGGGGYPPPLRFFADSGKTAARSAAKFGTTILSSILHMVCKFEPPNF